MTAGCLVLLPAAVDGVLFGFPMFDVCDIGPPPISVGRGPDGGPPGYVGVAREGPLATVVDLRAAFGRPATENAPGRSAIYVAHGDVAYGFIVDAVGDCLRSEGRADAASAPLWARAYAAEAHVAPIGVVLLLDRAGLLAPPADKGARFKAMRRTIESGAAKTGVKLPK